VIEIYAISSLTLKNVAANGFLWTYWNYKNLYIWFYWRSM